MNSSEIFGRLFDVVHLLGTIIDKTSNVIQAQLGDAGTDTPDSHNAEWWQHIGFVSRPAAPTPGVAKAEGLCLYNSKRKQVFATRDTKGTAIYGNLADGETGIYAAGSQARTLYKKNGAIVHFTTADNTASGQQVMAYIGPDKIQLANQWGAITIDSTGITLAGANGQAAIKIGASSGRVDVLGQQVNVQGSLCSVSGSVATCIGPNASPTPGVQSAIYGASGQTGVASTHVFIGP